MSAFPVTRLRRLRSNRRAALARARDAARPRGLRHAALRRPGDGAERGAAGDGPLVGGRRRRRGRCARLDSGVRAVILFGIPDEKDDEGSGAWDDDGVIQRALRELRPRFPELVLLTDVCLCEYTAHGHCGVIVDGEVDNDATLDLLARTAVSPRRGRRRRRLPERHDGRPRRGDPRGPARDADRRLLGEVRLGVLRAVPRGRRLGAVVRRPARLPDGSRPTSARRCASASWTSPRAPT